MVKRTTAGPGPNKYLLPPTVGYANHAVNKYRNPQYTMRGRYDMLSKAAGPGAKYNIANMTQHGKASPPAFSIYSRPKTLAPFVTPGPDRYKAELVPRMKERRPPAYSLYSRTKELGRAEYPGPKYNIPTTIGPKVPDMHAAGAYTISGKYDLSTKERSPGPAKYGGVKADVYKPKQPAFSLRKRHDLVGKERSPGPAAYKAQLPKRCMGGFSFGHRTDTQPYVTADDDAPCIEK